MINERIISEKFSAIWRQNFPLLTPNFIKVFNETQIREVNPNAVPIIEDIRYDLVSEASFNLSEIAVENKISPSDYLLTERGSANLLELTATNLWATDEYSPTLEMFSKLELEDIQKLSDNIIEFIGKNKISTVEFRPKLKGYGVIPDLEADLSIDETLYEIKTVTRNFKSSDLKQLFIYLALKQTSEESNWNYAGLYNPRKGKYCKFNIRNLVYRLSGGNTPNEAFENLLNGIIRDIEIDSKF